MSLPRPTSPEGVIPGDALLALLSGQEGGLGGILSEGALRRLLPALSLHLIDAGALILEPGEPARDLYLIHSGLVRIEGDGRGPGGWLGAGAWLGVGAALGGEAQGLRATARRDTALLALPVQALEAALASDGGAPLALLRFARRWEGAPDAARPPGEIIAAVVEAASDLEGFVAEHVAPAVGRRPGALSLTLEDVAARFGEGVMGPDPAPGARLRLGAWLDGQLGAHGLVVLWSDERARGWRRYCRRQGERVWVFNAVSEGLRPTAMQQNVFLPTDTRPKQLIVVNPGAAPLPPDALERWALPRQLGQVHVLSASAPEQAQALVADLLEERISSEALRRLAPLADLPEAERARLAEVGTLMDVNGGQVLIEEGGRAGSVYLVLQGRFEVLRGEPGGEALATAGPGALLGELSVLGSQESRSATVRALRDSQVIHLTAADFRGLIDACPHLARAVMARVARRASSPSEPAQPPAITNVAVVILTDTGREAGFAESLAEVMGDFGPCALIGGEELNRALGPGAASIGRSQPGDGRVLAWLHELEAEHTTVVYRCDPGATPWTRRALRQADRILLVADAAASPEVRPLEARLLGDSPHPTPAPVHLALIQDAGVQAAADTLRWLLPREGVLHHHVRQGDRGDLASAARRLTQRAIGVAFSGASTRGPAHLGVVRFLREMGVPIDIVAGSSSGSGAACLTAMNLPQEETFRRGIITNSPRLKGTPNPPYVSLFRSDGQVELTEEMFGEGRIEDQLIPCILSAMDINNHRAVWLTRGTMAEMVQASCSLPVIWPPRWHGEQLLVDGGIVSYLPLDAILDVCAQGTAIASDLDPAAGKEVPAFAECVRYGDEISGWSLLFKQLNPFASKEIYPSLPDILFHSLCYPSFQHQRRLRELEGRPGIHFVRPPLASFGIFDVTDDQARELEVVAYDHAREVLAPFAAAWSRG